LFLEERKFSNYLLTLYLFVVFVFRRLALKTLVIIYFPLSSFSEIPACCLLVLNSLTSTPLHHNLFYFEAT